MKLILRYRKILVIIFANIVVAFLIAFLSVWLSYKNALQIAVPENEVYKPYVFNFIVVFIVANLFLFLLSFLLLNTTKPILEDILRNEKDINKAKKKTERNERALTTLLKNLPFGLVLYDVKEDVTYYNDYAISYLGFTNDQYKVKGIAGPPLRLLKEDGSDMPLDEYPLNKIITEKSILKNQIGGILGKSGNVAWVLYNAFPVYNYFGNLKQVMVTFLDVTEQRNLHIELKEANLKLKEQKEELIQLLDNIKELNTKLAESEARYKLISDFSTSWETYRHPDGKLVYCSPAVEELIGYTPEEYLAGVPFKAFVHPDDLERFMEQYNNGISGKTVPTCVVRLLHKNQTLKWIDYALRPVLSQEGKLIGTRFSVRDITKLKETELALYESRELLNLIFQYSNDWEGYRDKDGKLLYSSLALEQMLGYQTSDYLSGKLTHKDIVHPDDYEETTQILDKAYAGETIKSHILRFIHKNKKVVWADTSARPVFSESGEMLGFRITCKDITKLKESELELKELNATKDKFFSIISHDLKSPFNALIGFSNILLEEHKIQPVEEREQFISYINETSKNTLKLLENLLDWARSQSGKLKLNYSEVNLKELSVEITELLRNTAQNKKISLVNNIKDDIWVWVDSNLLHTIIRNLISNSIKYTNEFGIINMNATIKEIYAEVSVSDTGIGIDQSILNTLFKIGENRSTEGTNGELGTGLGLILCKDFVEKMGGQIWASSEPGKGSTFYFTLPLSKK